MINAFSSIENLILSVSPLPSIKAYVNGSEPCELSNPTCVPIGEASAMTVLSSVISVGGKSSSDTVMVKDSSMNPPSFDALILIA